MLSSKPYQLPLFAGSDNDKIAITITHKTHDSFTAVAFDGWYMAVKQTEKEAVEAVLKLIQDEQEYYNYMR